MKHVYRNLSMALAAVAAATALNSCLIQQGVEVFIRDTFPGDRPPAVITKIDNSTKWLKPDEDVLPPSSHVNGRIRQANDGIPYGLTSEFSNIVVSPYAPHYPLDYTGVPVGTKVWDPYTRKPFYIPRAYTFN